MWGDVTGNGVVDADDALQILFYVVNLSNDIRDSAGNYNASSLCAALITANSISNGTPDADDALQILFYVVSLSSNLTA